MVLSDIVGCNLTFFSMLISLQDEKKQVGANDSLEEPGCGSNDPDLNSSMHQSSGNKRCLWCCFMELLKILISFFIYSHIISCSIFFYIISVAVFHRLTNYSAGKWKKFILAWQRMMLLVVQISLNQVCMSIINMFFPYDIIFPLLLKRSRMRN